MTISASIDSCMLCECADREIVQTQSLALLNRDALCEVHFAVCHSCGHLQQWPPVPPELMAHHYRTFASYELFGNPADLRATPPRRHAGRLLSPARDIG